MNRHFRVIWNKARALVTHHAPNFAVTRNHTAALLEALEVQEEENLAWIMQLHSQSASSRNQCCMPDRRR